MKEDRWENKTLKCFEENVKNSNGLKLNTMKFMWPD